MRGSKAKRLRRQGLRAANPVRKGTPHVPSETRFDHAAERRSKRHREAAS